MISVVGRGKSTKPKYSAKLLSCFKAINECLLPTERNNSKSKNSCIYLRMTLHFHGMRTSPYTSSDDSFYGGVFHYCSPSWPATAWPEHAHTLSICFGHWSDTYLKSQNTQDSGRKTAVRSRPAWATYKDACVSQALTLKLI